MHYLLIYFAVISLGTVGTEMGTSVVELVAHCFIDDI
jgi:hypothetical protein